MGNIKETVVGVNMLFGVWICCLVFVMRESAHSVSLFLFSRHRFYVHNVILCYVRKW